ncbi:hypothetical protein KDA_73960 [Dictyobacter alpinus]|uniref:Cytochrome b561 domain-containing protein n=1 Tax=Dictyobacter alpinus TaxID=2014873 RepID=A0A402BKP6_9CHLR|nr:hypothetical protein [Dictyobacter alpinus]GCE31912.1 hypothetical protein KDA_73960 [Dictyobacter alpinus]
MKRVRLVRILSTIATVITAALGIGTYTHVNFTNMHILFGLLVAFMLLLLSLLATFTRELRGLGAIGIVYAVVMPLLGVKQQLILVGDLHWLIETTHLAVGFGALALIGVIGERLAHRKTVMSKDTFSSETA